MTRLRSSLTSSTCSRAANWAETRSSGSKQSASSSVDSRRNSLGDPHRKEDTEDAPGIAAVRYSRPRHERAGYQTPPVVSEPHPMDRGD